MSNEINWKSIDSELSAQFEKIKIQTMMCSDSHSSDLFKHVISTYLETLKTSVIDMDKQEFTEEKKDIILMLVYNLNHINSLIKESLSILKALPNFEIDNLKVLLIIDAINEGLKQKYANRL